MEAKQKIEELTKQLNHYNHRYYVDHVSEISDREFDMLMRELMELEKQHPHLALLDSPTQRVGSDLQQEFRHVKHNVPMLSLTNAYSVPELLAWYESVKAVYGKDVAIAYEPKYDGLSISLIYRYGKLVQAVTRGDGVQGDDVTENVKRIERVPLVIKEENIQAMPRFEIRGEVLMPFKSFEKVNAEREANGEEPFANPRNAAAGTLKSTRSSVVRERMLDVYLYEVVDWPWSEQAFDNYTQKWYDKDQCWAMNYLWCEGVPTAQSFLVNVNSAKMAQAFEQKEADYIINDFSLRRPLMDYPIDGIVFKVANRYQRNLCGSTSKAPKWAIAYKFNAERRITTIRDVTFQVGRTGAVTPVVHFDPIPLAGTLVRKATGNNEDYLHSLHIAIGGQIEVEKAGEIIPQIVKGVDPYATKGFKQVEFPERCPECDAPLVKEGSTYYCDNEQCPAQLQARMEHFVSREAMNIVGVGPKMIEEWIGKRLLEEVADFYAWTPWMMNSEKVAVNIPDKIFAAIQASKQTPAHRVLFALGIRHIGASTAKLLLKHYPSVDMLAAVVTAAPEMLQDIEGVGEETAASLHAWFSNPENLRLLNRLKEAGLQMEERQESPSGEPTGTLPLAGLTIVISGTFEYHSRDEYRAMIEQYGGKNGSGVSKNTSYLLAGANMGPAKREKAENLGVEIIDEKDFLEMINGK